MGIALKLLGRKLWNLEVHKLPVRETSARDRCGATFGELVGEIIIHRNRVCADWWTRLGQSYNSAVTQLSSAIRGAAKIRFYSLLLL